ncbi:hypothetical protein ACOBQX_03295 [Actinokineospora sp. G85]|uniref:hypothetical protein n=1 Tax=Actinokineospora sp. G85 TaxID=3406626 RepID=UPI003C78332A
MSVDTSVDYQDRELDAVLRALRGPNLYRDNVFRLTGLPVTATPKQIRRAREDAAMTARLAAATKAADPGAARQEDVDAAFEALRNPVLRLVHEVLWEWGADTHTKHDRAVRVHRRAIEDPAPEDDERVQEWAAALNRWREVLGSEQTWERVRARVAEIDDPRLTTGTARRIRERLPRLLVEVHVDFAARAARAGRMREARAHREVLRRSRFAGELVDAALRDAVRPFADRVRSACEGVQAVVGGSGAALVAKGRTLVEDTRTPLLVVTALLGDGPVAGGLRDEVAKVLNQCAVEDFEGNDRSAPALRLLDLAEPLAHHARTKTLLRDNRSAIAQGPVIAAVLPHCARGRVDYADDLLWLWRQRTTNPTTRAGIDQIQDNDELLGSVGGTVRHWSVFGIGTRLLVSERHGPDSGVLCRWVTYLWIPLFPLRRYKFSGQRVHGRLPLTSTQRWWRHIGLQLVSLALCSALFADSPFTAYLVALAAALIGNGVYWYRVNAEVNRLVEKEKS